MPLPASRGMDGVDASGRSIPLMGSYYILRVPGAEVYQHGVIELLYLIGPLAVAPVTA